MKPWQQATLRELVTLRHTPSIGFEREKSSIVSTLMKSPDPQAFDWLCGTRSHRAKWKEFKDDSDAHLCPYCGEGDT